MLASALQRLGLTWLVSAASVLDAVEGLPQMEGIENVKSQPGGPHCPDRCAGDH